ncbi:hypothetical protein PENTCL1PPCAC_7401, partial [Pristionchus entomophagus]
TNEAERIRNESLYTYASIELMNYNNECFTSQFLTQGGHITALRISEAAKTVTPEIRFDQSKLLGKSLMVARPGFPGEFVDIRAIA